MLPGERKSKSQRKRERQALQTLGVALVRLPPPQLARLPLSSSLREAVLQAKRLSRSAYQRQIRYLGGLLENADEPAIRRALEDLHRPSREAVARFHKLEHWRDRLINEGESALRDLPLAFPSADQSYLLRLLEELRQETGRGKPGRQSTRVLFRYLQELEEKTLL
jgi:ribosome-associated protein